MLHMSQTGNVDDRSRTGLKKQYLESSIHTHSALTILLSFFLKCKISECRECKDSLVRGTQESLEPLGQNKQHPGPEKGETVKEIQNNSISILFSVRGSRFNKIKLQ